MLKVNEEKILADYTSLVEKKEQSAAKIEADTRAFAATLGYDENKTKDLVAFIISKDNGLSAEENAKLEALSAYIDEVEESAEESEVVKRLSEAIPAVGATVTNI